MGEPGETGAERGEDVPADRLGGDRDFVYGDGIGALRADQDRFVSSDGCRDVGHVHDEVVIQTRPTIAQRLPPTSTWPRFPRERGQPSA